MTSMKKESDRVHSQKKKALNISIKEGASSSISSNLGDSYITPFALLLSKNPIFIGILRAFPPLLSPLAQAYGSRLMKNHSRKKITTLSAFIQALLWIPIAILSILVWKGIPDGFFMASLVTIYALVAVFGGLSYPAWFSWMGDLVPEDFRGKYFAKRNRAIVAVSSIVVIVSSFFLDLFETHGLLLIGFSILFFLAFVFRFGSFLLLRKQYSPRLSMKKDSYFSFKAFLKRYDNFGKFAVFNGLFYLAIMISSPFFAVYMLEDLKFDYVTYAIVSMSYAVYYVLFTPLAGKFSDRFGNKKLLYISCFFFALTPILWLFIRSPIWLILLPELSTGLANAGFDIAFVNFIYDNVSKEKRGVCISYTNILIGIGSFIGPLLGGIIVQYTNPSFMNPFLFIFLIAAVLRIAVSLIFLPQIREYRKTKKMPSFEISFAHPIKALHRDFHAVKNIIR